MIRSSKLFDNFFFALEVSDVYDSCKNVVASVRFNVFKKKNELLKVASYLQHSVIITGLGVGFSIEYNSVNFYIVSL